MRITVNQAIKLRNKLERISFMPATAFQVSTMEPDPHATKDLAIKEFEQGLNTLMMAEEVIFELRESISKANYDNGAIQFISKIAFNERLIKSLSDVKPGYGSSSFDTYIEHRKYLDTLKEADPTQIHAPKRVTVSALDEEKEEEIHKRIKELKLEIESLQEKRNEINHQTYIELPKDMVEFLREHQLIK